LNTLDDYAEELSSQGVPYGMFTGKVSRKEKKRLIDQFNRGGIKALLVSSAGGEGLDLKGTRQVQVLDPHWNDEKIEQVIGRAIRHGSHTHLPAEEQTVHVQRFEAIPLSNAKGVEQILNDTSERKKALRKQLIGLLE
jgi:SNF2 family DNA or RNA helicase